MRSPVILLFVGLVFFSCTGKLSQEKLITVKGEVPASEMGVTLIHEHILVDFIGADSTGYHRWNRSEVVMRAMPFLLEAKGKGVKTFLDCTPAYLGRDPLLLRELSEKSGIQILTNTGFYGAVNNKFIPGRIKDMSAEEMSEIWIDEFNNGIEGSGVFPGFIKISVDENDVLSPIHSRIVKAAAIAHKATGLTIVSHTGKDGPAFAQLRVLREEGVAADAFVWTHAQAGTMEGYIRAAREGAWISLDNMNKDNLTEPGGIEWFISILTRLKKEKLLHKVLISHDAGWYNVGQENGGNYRGYTDIFEHLVPSLLSNGFSKEDIDTLLVRNPQKAYAIRKRTV